MKTHHILYIHPWSDLYGSSRYLYELVTKLQEVLYTPIVVLPDKGPLLNSLKRSSIKSMIVSLCILNRKHTISEVIYFFIRFFSGIFRVAVLIRKHNVELVHTNTCHVLTGAIAAKIMRVPHIWHIHERDIPPAFLRKRLAKMVLFLSKEVITVSEENTRRFFGSESCSSKISVISGGVDLSIFSEAVSGQDVKDEFNLDEDTKVVGMVGRITPWKGQHYFLEAACKVIEVCPNTKFLVVGDTDVPFNDQFKKGLIESTKNLGMGQNVIFTGFRQDVPELLAAMDMLVLPSIEPEPFGLVLIEAMAVSRAVIATAIGGPLEIIDDRNTGILVPPRDSNKLAEAICELLSNELKKSEMGRKGRKRVENLFTWDKTVQRVESIYQKVLA